MTVLFVLIAVALAFVIVEKDQKTDPPGMFSLNMPIDGSVVENPEDVTLMWSKSPEAGWYSVYVREVGETDPIVAIESIKDAQCRVSLEPGKTYEWIVFAFNPYGRKSPSVAPFRFTTKNSG